MPQRPPKSKRPPRSRPNLAISRRWPRAGLALGGAAIAGLVVLVWFCRLVGPSPLDEARSALTDGRMAVAERALIRATTADPADPIPWRLRLEVLRLEDRRHEARIVGDRAIRSVGRPSRVAILKDLTLALLADVPDDLARSSLRRAIDADPADVDARVALLRRFALDPRSEDPGLPARVEALDNLLAEHPDHVGVREALIDALGDAGDPVRGRRLLDIWPEAARDDRYDRLAGRWALEFEGQPELALAPLQRAAALMPQDMKAGILLARAFHALGKTAEAGREAERVARLRERLEPTALARRLDASLSRLDEPSARRDLADLCEGVGLDDLAAAWRREAVPPVGLGR